MLGQYAAEHGASNRMKEFGRALVADHTEAKRQMSSVARTLGITPPPGATIEADAERVKLISLNGKDFDQEFAQYMVKDHYSDIAKFKEEVSANEGVVSAMAAKQLPALEKHLAMAKSLTRN
jgi:putative membrane protein